MRLHHRQIRASFWNDPQLLEWTRDKRLFYLGLAQLADDSGCLEESPLAFKANLFPVDQDITIEQLQQWVEELIEAEKLVRYQGGSKRCLYMSTFHRHQHLKNAGAPSLPLPPWITWQPFASNTRTGRYLVSQELLTECLQVSQEPITKCFQYQYQHEHEHEVTPTGLASPAQIPDQKKDLPETPPETPKTEGRRRKRTATESLERAMQYDPVGQIVVQCAEELHDPRPPPELYKQVLGVFGGDRMPHADKASLLYQARTIARSRVWTPETRKKRGPPGAPNRVPDFLGALQDLVAARHKDSSQNARDGPG